MFSEGDAGEVCAVVGGVCVLCAGVDGLEVSPRGVLCAECAEALFVWLRRRERAERVGRIREGRRVAQSRGEWHSGSPPYGWRPAGGGRLVAVPAELAVCAWVCRQRERGFSWREIVGELERAGTPGPRGGGWSVSTLRRIVERGSSPPAAALVGGGVLADVVAPPAGVG